VWGCCGISARPGRTSLDDHIPPSPLSWRWIALTVLIFAGATVLAYNLPLLDIAGYNQLSLMEFGFAAVGLVWLPSIAIVVGLRAYDRETRRLEP
jgi:hypothetical protein